MDAVGRKKNLDWFDSINLDGLKEEISRVLGLSCQFTMDTANRPFGGSECIIVVLEDAKGSKWAARFPQQFHPFQQAVISTVEQEVALRLAIEKNGISSIPKLRTYSATFENPARYPYTVVEWVEGTQLRWTDTYPDLPQRNKIIRSVVDAVLDLLKVRNEEHTATSYITKLIDRKIQRAQDGKLPGATEEECLDQMDLISEYLVPGLDEAPCVLVHGDLSTENIIVDHDSNFKAFIDLGFAEMIPFQFAACFPNFLTHDFQSLHEQVETVYGSGTNGPLVWRSKNTAMMQRDRAFYLQCVEESCKGDPMLEEYYRLLAAEDEIRRYWWLMAATKLNVHRAMAACNWLRPQRLEK